jgi:hypothetical protein
MQSTTCAPVMQQMHGGYPGTSPLDLDVQYMISHSTSHL